MSELVNEILPPIAGTYNLSNYEETAENFQWDSVHSHFSWYSTNKVNMAYECIDVHVENGAGEKNALIYVNGSTRQEYTFSDLKRKTDELASLLQAQGVKKGDRVFVFLPKHPDCYIAILSIIKIGAIAGPLFEAFMEEAIYDRMYDCEASVLITNLELLPRVPVEKLPQLQKVFVTDDTTNEGTYSIPQLINSEIQESVTEWVDLEDGMIIHYTSGSTGKPKGVLHAHRVMIQQYQTGKWVLDLKGDDVYWCTAHPGWVTGSSYGIFAPWLNGATIVVHGGRFSAEEWFQVLQDEKVTVWYSAPTAFRLLMEHTEKLSAYNLSSLRHILSVGEPLNPEVITWGYDNLKLRIHDTWWMTETGAQLIVNIPSATIKPGSMGRPLPGIKAAIINENGEELPPGQLGLLAIHKGWPSMMKEIWKNEEKYHSYFVGNWYVSGDLATLDEDGYVFFQGRSDDMINSSGERIGPFEVESKLIEHPAVIEAAVIGKPDAVRGEIVKAFIVLAEGVQETDELKKEIQTFVRYKLSAHAMPREIEVLQELPKTQISGKILRRVLKANELSKVPEGATK